MLIDDGENLRMGQEIAKHFANNDLNWLLSVEKGNGRFRPAYWLWHWLNFQLFHTSVLLHHSGHLLLFVGIAILIYLITYKITRSVIGGILSVYIYFLFYPIAENYFRLGTAEPQLTLLYLGIVYFIAKIYICFITRPQKPCTRYLFYLMLLYSIAYFMKETSPILLFALIPVGVVGLLDQKVIHKRRWFFSFLFLLLFNLLLFVLVLKIKQAYGIGGGYTDAYQLRLKTSLDNYVAYLKLITKYYQLLLLLPLINFFKKTIISFRNNNYQTTYLWELVLSSWFVLFLAVQAPWTYVMGRYLMPVTVWLAIFMAVEYSEIINSLKHVLFKTAGKQVIFRLSLTSVFAFSCLLLLLVYQGEAILRMYKSAVTNERYTRNVVRYLSQTIPINGHVYVNFSEGIMEYLYELPLHFRLLYGRPDIMTDYLYLENANIYQKGDYVISFKESVQKYPRKLVEHNLVNAGLIPSEAFGPEWEILRFQETEDYTP